MEIDKKKIKLMPLSHDNIPKVATMEKRYFSQPWSENCLREELGSSNSCFLVAMIGEEVIGYLGMYCVCKEGYVTNFAVDEEFRRYGIGRFILNQCINFARGNNFKFVSLEVRGTNRVALKLYFSEGFRRTGMRKSFYRYPDEDAIILTKYL